MNSASDLLFTIAWAGMPSMIVFKYSYLSDMNNYKKTDRIILSVFSAVNIAMIAIAAAQLYHLHNFSETTINALIHLELIASGIPLYILIFRHRSKLKKEKKT